MENVQVVQSKQNLEDGQIKHHEHIHCVRMWVWCGVWWGWEWRGGRWEGVGGTYSSLRYLKNGAATVMTVSVKPG